MATGGALWGSWPVFDATRSPQASSFLSCSILALRGARTVRLLPHSESVSGPVDFEDLVFDGFPSAQSSQRIDLAGAIERILTWARIAVHTKKVIRTDEEHRS
jgi:hypothetical protein